MKEKFEDRKFTGAIRVACKYENAPTRYWETTKEEVIRHIREIVRAYAAEGYTLTLRQLHYQLVTENWIINHDTAYKKLGTILDDCRYGGLIDWNAIEDRGRVPYLPYHVENVEAALQDTIDQYRIDRQGEQEVYIELWTEKDALSGILRRSTEKYHVQLVVNKGYTSSSAIYAAYKRVAHYLSKGRKVVILYFGDHDPSGLDMIRDVRERLELFLTSGESITRGSDFYNEFVAPWWADNRYTIYDIMDGGYTTCDLNKLLDSDEDEAALEFEKGQMKMFLKENELFKVAAIGLTMEQIKKYKLPENPTKLTDTRSEKYVKKYGRKCWEVDALKPQVLTAIVEKNIEAQINMALYNDMLNLEAEGVEKLQNIVNNLK